MGVLLGVVTSVQGDGCSVIPWNAAATCALTARAGAFDRHFSNVLRNALSRRMNGGWLHGRRGVAPRRGAVLAGATAWALVRDELAVIEDLAAPHASSFPPINCAAEADEPGRASGTQGFGELQLRRCLREPQVGIVHLARQVNREAQTCRVSRLRSALSSTSGSPAITQRSCTR